MYTMRPQMFKRKLIVSERKVLNDYIYFVNEKPNTHIFDIPTHLLKNTRNTLCYYDILSE